MAINFFKSMSASLALAAAAMLSGTSPGAALSQKAAGNYIVGRGNKRAKSSFKQNKRRGL